MSNEKDLLTVIELGGYPDFSSLYKSLGFTPHQTTSVRNAIRLLKNISPVVIVAEFNFQSDFRDRTSSLESLLSTVQGAHASRVIVFYDREFEHQLERLTAQYPLYATIPFPVDEVALSSKLKEAVEG